MNIFYTFFLVPAVTIASSVIWIRVLKRADSFAEVKGSAKEIGNFFLCGFLSIPLTYLIHIIAEPVYYFFYGSSFIIYFLLYDFLIVGVVEEAAKFLIFFIFALQTGAIREPKDGIVYGAAVALAFAVVENVIYAKYGVFTLFYRSVMAAAGHMSLAAAWGYITGIILFTQKSEKTFRIRNKDIELLIYSIIFSAFIHGLYNTVVNTSFIYGILINILSIIIALNALKHLDKRSPYRNIPYDRYKEAIPLLKMGLSANPGNFALNRQAALHYIRAGNTDKALIHLKTAAWANPKNLSTRLYLNIVKILAGESGPSYLKAEETAMKMKLSSIERIRREALQLFKDSTHKSRADNIFKILIEEKRRINQTGHYRINYNYSAPVKPRVDYSANRSVRYARPTAWKIVPRPAKSNKAAENFRRELRKQTCAAPSP